MRWKDCEVLLFEARRQRAGGRIAKCGSLRLEGGEGAGGGGEEGCLFFEVRRREGGGGLGVCRGLAVIGHRHWRFLCFDDLGGVVNTEKRIEFAVISIPIRS